MRPINFRSCFALLFVVSLALPLWGREDCIQLDGLAGGPGEGKHVVLLAGDEEYRSEEAMPMLAELLARQGFKCTVLFSLNDKGQVDPRNQKSLSCPEALDTADLLVMSLRFRQWGDATMKRFEACLERGIPVVALRTSTHAFKFPADSPWAKYSFNAKAATGWKGGFGRQVLGESWVSHHGKHKKEGTRAIVEKAASGHPLLRGVGEIFVESDVYEAHPLEDAGILLRGQVTQSLKPDSKAVSGKKNDPMMPVAWTRRVDLGAEQANRIFTTTMGAASDLDDADLRRLVVNAVYWGLELKIPEQIDVTPAGPYEPTFYGFGTFRKNLEPGDFLTAPPGKPDAGARADELAPARGEHIALVGNGLASRMGLFGHFETELQLRFPEHKLYIRNFADEGNTPGFRPHAGRREVFAFPGAKELVAEEFRRGSGSKGFFPKPDEWLERHKTDRVIAFFGSVSAYRGRGELPRFRQELKAYLAHLKSQKYNGKTAPEVVLVGPTALEDLRPGIDQPDIPALNRVRAAYHEAMHEVAAGEGVAFVDLFDWSSGFTRDKRRATIDGLQLAESTYRRLAPRLADKVLGKMSGTVQRDHQEAVLAAVREKNRLWLSDFKIPNGVHVYGRRYKPFGPQNYPDELKKIREMTAVRDRAIWAALQGESFDLAEADAATHQLPSVKTNYRAGKKTGSTGYLYGDQAIEKLKVAEGYQVELFADERAFPELANPVQMRFDNQGRLWVACMPSYPHWRPGDPPPSDSLLILEDTDGDGKADKRTVFAGDLHVPTGFELTHEGVVVAQGKDLVLLRDRDGDDRCDEREVLLSGLDDHDTHHAAGAFETDPAGAIFLSEGVFLHSNVETVHGTARGTNGGFFRFNLAERSLERTAQLRIPNPWGTVFDDWGQPFFLHTSGPSLEWMTPGRVRPVYGVNRRYSPDLVPGNKRVRPTSGLEIVSSRHFPEEVQGDLLINNNIGFRGIRQHQVSEKGTGYQLKHRCDLLQSADGNFRPVDLEFAPDGSLYFIDWSNALIGHMQHNARDPYRDHAHGRVYRITCKGRPLLKPPEIAGARVEALLDLLKEPELRTRQRVRCELRGRPVGKVMGALQAWVDSLDGSSPKLARHLTEAMWVGWGLGQPDPVLVDRVLGSEDHRARAAAVHLLRYNTDKIPGAAEKLIRAAADAHGRVRLEALVAASWVGGSAGREILAEFEKHEIDSWMKTAHQHTKSLLAGEEIEAEPETPQTKVPAFIEAKENRELYRLGHAIYHRDAHCSTCHQSQGQGLPPTYPPLAGSQWVTGDPERLTKIVLHGLQGEIAVNGTKYGENMPPMTAFGQLLPDDRELAAVINYVRNSWGNRAEFVTPDKVAAIRKATRKRSSYWTPEELLEEHPMKRQVKVAAGAPLIAGRRLENSRGGLGVISGSLAFVAMCVGLALVFRSGGP